jgi:ribosomal protein L6P/L9E
VGYRPAQGDKLNLTLGFAPGASMPLVSGGTPTQTEIIIRVSTSVNGKVAAEVRAYRAPAL